MSDPCMTESHAPHQWYRGDAITALRASPRFHTSPVLAAVVRHLELGADPVRLLCETVEAQEEAAAEMRQQIIKAAERLGVSVPPEMKR